jgi:hypothetical protein
LSIGIWVATIFLGHVIILTRLVWDIVNAPYGTLALALELFLSGIYTRNFLRYRLKAKRLYISPLIASFGCATPALCLAPHPTFSYAASL